MSGDTTHRAAGGRSGDTTEGAAGGRSGDTTEGAAGDQPIREHEPLMQLLSQIPQKVQRGMKSQHEDLALTCIDANEKLIALGSSIGIVFLYDREKQFIQRLRSETTTDSVTCVCLHHGLDDLVAIGYQSSTIYIFQLPSMLIGHSKQLERFIVADLHNCPLKCLAWSTNGMKLYSGDMKGSVGCTEVDFIEGKCKSSMLLIEANTEIIQLNQGHRSLLVSTRHRCIVCRTDDRDRVVQVGSKDRKIQGDFGACFIPSMCKPDDAFLFASRPGYRIWKSSISGTVTNTFIFRELVSRTHSEIPLLPFEVTNILKGASGTQFGPLLLFRDKDLVTWNDTCLFVIRPEDMVIVGSQKHIGCIRSVAVTGEEIFVLRTGTDRNVIRIASEPPAKPTSHILKQLQLEREEKEKERQSFPPATVKAKEPDQPAEGDNSSSKDKQISPFKFLQENVLEKVKQIPTPVVLKEKIQEKLKSDKSSDDSLSRYNQPYVFEGSDDQTERRDRSPPGKLPPVVLLDSPNLPTLELNIDMSSQPDDIEESGLSMKTIPTGDRFSILVGETSVSETEISGAVNQSSPIKTGTGAVSALARLQEDHQEEVNSEPVYLMKGVTEPEPSRAPMMNYTVTGEEDEIVFKPKHKKKKKGTKDKKHRSSRSLADKDPDAVSVTSTTSDNSETTSRRLTNASEVSNEELMDSDTFNKYQEETNEVQGATEMAESEISKTMEGGSESSDVINAVIDNTIVSEDVKVIPDGDTTHSEDTAIVVDVVIEAESDEKVPVESNAPKPDISSVEVISNSSPDPVELVKAPGKAPSIGNAEYDNMNISSLDREMARLDSYLSGKSDSDLEQSTNVNAETGAKKSDIDDILLKGVKKNTMEQGRAGTALLESDSKYEPSSLEKELYNLEKSALMPEARAESDEPSGAIGAPSPVTSEPRSPSIYSIYKTPSTSSEDFYTKYSPKSPSSLTSVDTDPLSSVGNIDATKDNSDNDDEEFVQSMKISDSMLMVKSLNNWTEFPASGNIYSLSASHSHVWITDRSYNVFYSSLTAPGLSWKKATGNASQVSVSKYGNIIWFLNRSKNLVYAGTKITQRRPEGMKWVEAVRDVAYICVDETCAWYIKNNHEVMIQKHLSRDRPCYTAQSVDCSHRLKQIVSQSGVVWALTQECRWLYRDGVTKSCPEGTSWKAGDSGSENRLFTYITLGDGNLGWAVDVVGQVWFCCGVTMEMPRGDNKWWQVPLGGEYIMKDLTTMDLLKSFSQKMDPQKLALLLSSQSGGLISGTNGLWVCPEYKHVLHVCRGNIEGQLWAEAHPGSLSASSVWKTLNARNCSYDKGLVWAQQPNGDIFTFTPDRLSCSSVPGPPQKAFSLFVCLSVCADALWGLTADGEVFIRTGMSATQEKGAGWGKLDLSQLNESHLVSVSCGKLNVWAVDSDGNVFHRIGVKAPSDLSLNAAWLPVETGGTVFTQVLAGSQDWMVWAIDNRRQVYVRTGITMEMPIGRKWMHVSGSPAAELALSDKFVWALNNAGELLCRHGVSCDNPTGDYWKKLPATLAHISASPDNVLWAINKEGQLVRRYTKYIIKTPAESLEKEARSRGASVRMPSVCSDEGDWEFV